MKKDANKDTQLRELFFIEVKKILLGGEDAINEAIKIRGSLKNCGAVVTLKDYENSKGEYQGKLPATSKDGFSCELRNLDENLKAFGLSKKTINRMTEREKLVFASVFFAAATKVFNDNVGLFLETRHPHESLMKLGRKFVSELQDVHIKDGYNISDELRTSMNHINTVGATKSSTTLITKKLDARKVFSHAHETNAESVPKKDRVVTELRKEESGLTDQVKVGKVKNKSYRTKKEIVNEAERVFLQAQETSNLKRRR